MNTFAAQRALPKVGRILWDKTNARYPPVSSLLAAHASGGTCLCFMVPIAQMTLPFDKHQQLLKLFLAVGIIKPDAIDILEPLTWRLTGNLFYVLMIHRYIKLTRAFLVSKITGPKLAKVVPGKLVVPYGIPDVILTDNGKQCTIKTFTALCVSLDTKLVTTMEFHLQYNGKIEWHNRALTVILRHYNFKYRQFWNVFFQPLTCLYITQVRRTIGMTLFRFSIRRVPPGSLTRTSCSKILEENGLLAL